MWENLISLLRERRAGISPLRHSVGHSTEPGAAMATLVSAGLETDHDAGLTIEL